MTATRGLKGTSGSAELPVRKSGAAEAAVAPRRPAFGKKEQVTRKPDDFAGQVVAPREHGHVAVHGGTFQLGNAGAVDRSFATADGSATLALTALSTAFADAKFQAVLGKSPALTTADLQSIAKTGTLRGQALDKACPAVAKDVAAAAQFLTAKTSSAFLHQLAPKKELTALTVAAAKLGGFHDAHAAILKTGLAAFAKHAAEVSPPGAEHAFTLAELQGMADGGTAPNGKTLAESIPSASARASFVASLELIVDNPAVFRQLDLSGPGMANMAMTNGKFTVTDLNRLTGAGGAEPLPHRPTFEQLVKATLPQVPPPYFEPIEIHALAPAKRAELAKVYMQWADETGMVAHHKAWHSENGSGGTKGKKSGEKFIQFHAQMGDELKTWLLAQKPPRTDLFDEHGLLPTWDTTQPLPEEFWEGTVNHSIDWRLPAFLTTTAKKGETFKLDGRVISSLNDIKSPDELGRVWGESGAHAVAHNRLGDEMAGFASVRDPAFLLWHFGVIETNRALWLTTDSGKAWLKEHPSGWTDPNADAGHVSSIPKGPPQLGAPKTPFWGDDQLREAGVGFTDPKLRAEAKKRVDSEPRPSH